MGFESFRKYFAITVIAAVFILPTVVEANQLRREMTRLLSSMKSPLSTAEKAFKDASLVDDDSFDRAISKLDIAIRSAKKLQSFSPASAGSVDPIEKTDFIQAFKDRMVDFENLLITFQEEYRVILATNVDERAFNRLSAIGKQVEICRDESHSDFISGTALAHLHYDACKFLE